MKLTIGPKIEKRIRAAVKLGEPFALDDLIEEVCVEDDDRTLFSEVVADEYRHRLRAVPRQKMLELCRKFYKDATDANKDWLLGEIVESIEAERN